MSDKTIAMIVCSVYTFVTIAVPVSIIGLGIWLGSKLIG